MGKKKTLRVTIRPLTLGRMMEASRALGARDLPLEHMPEMSKMVPYTVEDAPVERLEDWFDVWVEEGEEQLKGFEDEDALRSVCEEVEYSVNIESVKHSLRVRELGIVLEDHEAYHLEDRSFASSEGVPVEKMLGGLDATDYVAFRDLPIEEFYHWQYSRSVVMGRIKEEADNRN